MKRKGYSEERIISLLKEDESRASMPDLSGGITSGPHGVAENTVYRWKSKCDGMEVSEVIHLREREHEKQRLKKLLTEAEIDKAPLKELVEGNW